MHIQVLSTTSQQHKVEEDGGSQAKLNQPNLGVTDRRTNLTDKGKYKMAGWGIFTEGRAAWY